MRLLIFIGASNGVMLHRLLIPYNKISELTDETFHIDYFVYEGQPIEQVVELACTYDYFVFNRTLPEGLIELLSSCSVKVICDIDDDWALPHSHPLYLNYLLSGTTARIVKHIKLSDYITTTTQYLANKIKTLNKNVVIFGNCLESNQYFPSTKSESRRIRFGILGSSSHTQDMVLLQDIANQLDQATLDRIQFVLCGFDSGKITHIDEYGKSTTKQMPYEDTCWAEWERSLTDNYKVLSDDYVALLKRFDNVDIETDEAYKRVWSKDVFSYALSYEFIDCLIVPLVDNEFNRCKSPLKLVEASVTNTGVICSNVQPYADYLNKQQAVNNAKRTRGFIQAIKRYVDAEDKSVYVPDLTNEGREFNLNDMTLKRIEWFNSL